MQKRLFLVDGSSFVFRGFYALPELRTRDGIPTGAVYAFLQMFHGFMNEYRPDWVVVAFDHPEPTFRIQIYEQYKANRAEPPETLVAQFPLVKEALEGLQVAQIERAGFEADDLIGTLSVRAAKEGFDVVIVTGDKDLLQLVSPCVKVLQSHYKNTKLYSEEEVRKRYGCAPERLPDLFGLMGDSVDNIPGVPGIGEKTAVALMQQFENLETLYARIEEVKGKRGETLQTHKDQAFLSRELARIKTDVDLDFSWEQARIEQPDVEKLARFYKRLEFRRLLEQLPGRGGRRKADSSKYALIATAKQLQDLCKRLKDLQADIAIDTETTSLDPMDGRLVGISLSWKAGEAAYLPLGHAKGENLALEHVREQLGPLLSDPEIGKCGHHLKFDTAFLEKAGLPLTGVCFDTLIASQLVEPEQGSHKLDNLARVHLDMEMTPIESLIGSGKSQKSMAEVDLSEVGPYACEDADATLQLMGCFRDRIESEGLAELFYDVELPLIDVLRRMELDGVYVDAAELAEQSGQLGSQLKGLEADIHRLAGVRFNVNSPKQLAEVLFDRMGLRAGRKRSTAIGVLEKLAAEGHEIASRMIEYRQISKLKSTYLDALPLMIHPRTGRIHTSYQQTGAGTGRISSSDPNLQNIPIRTDLGRRIRKAFQAPPETLLLSADYSQIELRVLAHLAEDPGLILAFESDQDIHSYTAREVFGIAEDQPVSPEARRRAKAINFGLNYGMTPYGLAQRLGIKPAEAKDYMDRYFSRYSRVLEYVEKTKEIARDQGYVTTLKGRRIPTLGVRSSNNILREAAVRAAINAPIQGSAADILKLAMVQMARRLRQEGLSCRMILTVHDEIVFEVPVKELEPLKQHVREVMEGVISLRVPLKVDLKSGPTWADL